MAAPCPAAPQGRAGGAGRWLPGGRKGSGRSRRSPPSPAEEPPGPPRGRAAPARGRVVLGGVVGGRHRIGDFGKKRRNCLVQPSLAPVSPPKRVPKHCSKFTLNTPRDGDSAASLGSPSQCSAALPEEKFLQICHLILRDVPDGLGITPNDVGV